MQDNEFMRKMPAQRRSKHTIDTILEATARILVDEGSERLTTNHLAERSGYSVGTVYQYFPNRESVVLALIERQREAVEQRIQALLDAQGDSGWEDRTRTIIRVLHEAFDWHRATDPRLMRSLMQLAVAHGLPEPGEALSKAIVDSWTSQGRQHAPPLNPAETFVLTRAILEVFRFATLQSSPLLGTRQLEDAVYRLVRGFLREGSPPRG